MGAGNDKKSELGYPEQQEDAVLRVEPIVESNVIAPSMQDGQENARDIMDLPQRVRERAVTEEPVLLEGGRRRCPRDVESPREMREDDHHAEIKDERVRRGGSMSVCQRK